MLCYPWSKNNRWSKGDVCGYASRKMPDGEYKDIAHPITPELRKEITDSVIARYNEMDLEEEAVEAVEE